MPNIVLDFLKMPDALACVCIQCQQAIRKHIISDPICAVEITCGRAGRNLNETALLIQRHTGPISGRSTLLPVVLRQSVIAVLARSRNRVE